MQPSTRYYFMHIPRTAGMVLYQRIARWFGEDAVYPLPEDSGHDAALDIAQLQRSLAMHGERFRVITGHFPLCLVDMLDGPVTTFTLLREPVDRALSLLRMFEQRRPEYRGWTLEEIYAEPIVLHGLIHNYMVKVLSMTTGEMQGSALTMVPYDDAHLELAKRNLETRIEVVGLQEEFEAFCSRLGARFGWSISDPSPYSNRSRPVETSVEFRERIAHDNAYDVQLYEFARELVAAQAASAGPS